jgi:exopolysaccharide production protein ExoZ
MLARIFELSDPRHARLLPMEGLRGLAVTLVFLQHYAVQAELIGLAPGGMTAAAAATFHRYGNLGVELFFILSGYLIYGTLVRHAPRFLAFMARRMERIYPTFLVVFAVALGLGGLAPVPSKIPEGFWPATSYLAANLALLPGLLPIRGVVDVAWTLSYEMFFCITCAVLVLGTGLHRASRSWRLVVLFGLTFAFVAASFCPIPYFPVRMMPFFAGMLLAEGMGARVPAWLAWVAPIASVLLSALLRPGASANELLHTVAFFALCAVCFRGAGRTSAVMIWAPLRWLGNISCSYYLMHGFVVRTAMLLLGHALPSGMPTWLFWWLMPVVFTATLVASAGLFVLIEKPLSLRPNTKWRPGFPGRPFYRRV